MHYVYKSPDQDRRTKMCVCLLYLPNVMFAVDITCLITCCLKVVCVCLCVVCVSTIPKLSLKYAEIAQR